VNTGQTNVMSGVMWSIDQPPVGAVQMINATAVTTAAGTAQILRIRPTKAQARTTGIASAGSRPTALAGARQSPSRMPASIALARTVGIEETSRPNGLIRPAATISAPASTKAPTAAGKPPSMMPVAANRTEPGVDQAMLSGMR